MNFCKESIRFINRYISDVKPLSKAETYDLIRKYKEGNKEAGERVVIHNLKYMLSMMPYYRRRYRVSVDELFTEGIFAIYYAMNGFNFKLDKSFTTYLTWWVRNKFNRYVIAMPTVRISKWVVGAKKYEPLKFISIDSFGVGKFESNTEQKHNDYILLEKIKQAINRLASERDKQIVRLYYGIDCKKHTLDQVGQKMSRSKERIRQILVTIYKELRADEEIRKIRQELF